MKIHKIYKQIVEPSIESHLSKSRSRGKVVHHYNCLPCCWFSLASFSPPLLPLTRSLPSPSLLFSSFFFTLALSPTRVARLPRRVLCPSPRHTPTPPPLHPWRAESLGIVLIPPMGRTVTQFQRRWEYIDAT